MAKCLGRQEDNLANLKVEMVEKRKSIGKSEWESIAKVCREDDRKAATAEGVKGFISPTGLAFPLVSRPGGWPQ